MVALPDVEHGRSRDEDVKNCIETEMQARKQLEKKWPRSTAVARSTCLGLRLLAPSSLYIRS
jgi:hypothetical protein